MHQKSKMLWIGFLCLCLAGVAGSAGKATTPEWSFNATIIEACSCPMFCPCYFNTEPAGHVGHEGRGDMKHFCKFNMAYKVNKGHHGDVKLNGVKFWVTGDLGSEFDDGQMDWAHVTFDKSMTQEQRDAVAEILGKIYPVKWDSFTTAEGTIDKWEADNDAAHATLDGGKTAEVKLTRVPGMTDDPVVLGNLKYWGVPRNDGFILIPNEVQAYHTGEKAFEYKGTNGFMVTLDINSDDVGE